MSNYSFTATHILLNILLISTFIVIFFFMYGSYIERSTIINEMAFLSESIYDSVKEYGPVVNNLIADKINSVNMPDLSAEDNMISELNKVTIWNAIKYEAIVFIGMLIIIGVIYYFSKPEIYLASIRSLIILIFIGLTEYIFLTYFGCKYMSLNPNVFKLAIVDNINKTINEL